MLFIDADVDLCVQRIYQRATQADSKDNHFVSEKVLRGYYAEQIIPFILHKYGIDARRVRFIRNNRSKELFLKEVFLFTLLVLDDENLPKTDFLQSIQSGKRTRPLEQFESKDDPDV